MNALWIAGLFILMALAVLMILALCRTAALADQNTESYLPDGSQVRQQMPEPGTPHAEDAPAEGMDHFGVSA